MLTDVYRALMTNIMDKVPISPSRAVCQEKYLKLGLRKCKKRGET